MKEILCTISTNSHLYKAYTLADSIKDYQLHVLVVDDFDISMNTSNNVFLYNLDVLNDKRDTDLIEKYKYSNDKLRWSLKPCFMKFLLKNYDKVIYVDNDIYFFKPPSFLFDELETFSLLLTPHYYENNPLKNQNWLEATLKMGLYNAGFIACNKNALKALDWWANCCLYRCEKNIWRGLWDDQKYLDLIPIIQPQTKVLTHRGCNVAEWNSKTSNRELINGEIIVNGKFPIVFYHFNNFSINNLDKESSLFVEYFKALKVHKSNIALNDLLTEESYISKVKLLIWNFLNKWNGTA